jgi:PAS domain S-box-containing protein
MSERKRILIVDDEEQNLDLLQALLESFGHESEIARNGFEALAKLNSSVDLVLLDVMMPFMDGFEVTRRIRHDPVCFDIPIIMVTGLTGRGDRLAAVEAGANDFITKPIDRVELRVRMASLLKMKEVQDAIKRHRAELEATVSKRTADLRDSEHRYRALFENSLDAILIVDEENRIVDVNRAFLDLLGFTREEVFTLNPRELFADPGDAAKLLNEILRKGSVRDQEWKVRTKGGSERDCVFTAALRREADGRVMGYQSIVHDVTDRNKAEKALKESEEKYRLLVDNANEGIIVCRNGRATFANAKAAMIMGYPLEQLTSSPFAEFVHQEDRQAFIDFVQNRPKTEALRDPLLFRIVNSEGATQWLEMKSVLVDWKNVPATLNFVEDVTTRKQAEDALRESEIRFRTVFESAQDIIFIKDRDLRYAQVNSAMLKVLQLPQEKLIGKTDEEVFGPEIAKDLRNLELRVLGEQSIETERTLLVDGKPITLNCMRVPLRDSAGKVNGICGIARDVTERQRRKRERPAQAHEYASDAMRTALDKARLAAGTDSIVMFLGEKGSGKGYLARYVHDRSRRANGPFFRSNCTSRPSNGSEVELFGQEIASVPGARGQTRGLLELAEGGTLLLNEIGDLSLELQARLVTFLDTRTFSPVGSERTVSVNTRIVAATSKNLEEEVEKGNFRKDLYYLLDVFPIQVPPLRRRKEDLPLLVGHLLEALAAEMGVPAIPLVTPEAMGMLSHYDWPGNVRELRNVLERAFILCDTPSITPEDVAVLEKVNR